MYFKEIKIKILFILILNRSNATCTIQLEKAYLKSLFVYFKNEYFELVKLKFVFTFINIFDIISSLTPKLLLP